MLDGPGQASRVLVVAAPPDPRLVAPRGGAVELEAQLFVFGVTAIR